MNTLRNVGLFLTILITVWLNRFTKNKGDESFRSKLTRLYKYQSRIYSLRMLTAIVIVPFTAYVSSSIILASFVLIVVELLHRCQIFIDSIIANKHTSIMHYTAMSLTFIASVNNLAKNSAPQL